MSELRVSWDDFEGDCVSLSETVSKQEVDIVVAPLRGGAFPGVLLSNLLRKPFRSLQYASYSGEKGRERGELILIQDISHPISGKKVLLVDDVSDSGETLIAAKRNLESKGALVVSASLYFKPHSKFRPDFFVHETGEWIIFPWEKHEL